MAISKKLRFEVLKRDGFHCVYCGKSCFKTVLQIDHITPKSKGGTDEFGNLVTSCVDCNQGKSGELLKTRYIMVEKGFLTDDYPAREFLHWLLNDRHILEELVERFTYDEYLKVVKSA